MAEFPELIADIDRALMDGDVMLVNKRKADVARLAPYILGAPDGSTPGSINAMRGLVSALVPHAAIYDGVRTVTRDVMLMPKDGGPHTLVIDPVDRDGSGAITAHVQWSSAHTTMIAAGSRFAGAAYLDGGQVIDLSSGPVELATPGESGWLTLRTMTLEVGTGLELYILVARPSSSAPDPQAAFDTAFSVLPETLALYRFRGGLDDSSPHARHLTTVTGTPDFRAHPLAHIDTYAGIAARHTDAIWARSTSYTVEAIARGDASVGATTVKNLVALTADVGAGSSNGALAACVRYYGGAPSAQYDAGATRRSVNASRRAPHFRRHHIAATYAIAGGSTTVSVYLDGVLAASMTYAETPVVPPNPSLWLGAEGPSATYGFTGVGAEIYGVAIHDGVMSEAMIAARAAALSE